MLVLAISVMFIKTLGYFESSGHILKKNLVFAMLSSLLICTTIRKSRVGKIFINVLKAVLYTQRLHIFGQ